MWGILFGISNASICGLMLQKIAGHYFWLIWNFWHFWPKFNFFHLFWPPMSRCNLTWKPSLILWLFKSNSAFSEAIMCHEWQKKIQKFQIWAKQSKIPNQPKIMSCNFLRHQTTYGWIWYAKQNPPHRGLSG